MLIMTETGKAYTFHSLQALISQAVSPVSSAYIMNIMNIMSTSIVVDNAPYQGMKAPMGCHNIGFLPLQASLTPHFSQHILEVMTTCLYSVVGGKQGHATFKYFHSNKFSALRQLIVMKITRLYKTRDKFSLPCSGEFYWI